MVNNVHNFFITTMTSEFYAYYTFFKIHKTIATAFFGRKAGVTAENAKFVLIFFRENFLYYFRIRNFRVQKLSRFSRILCRFAKVNVREKLSFG